MCLSLCHSVCVCVCVCVCVWMGGGRANVGKLNNCVIFVQVKMNLLNLNYF